MTVAQPILRPEELVEAGLPVLDGDRRNHQREAHDLNAAIRGFAERHCSGAYGRYLPEAYTAYDEWNARFFNRALPTPAIAIAAPASPNGPHSWYADYSGYGTSYEIGLNVRMFRGDLDGIDPERSALGFSRLIKDLVLHAMVHAHQHLLKKEREDASRGHGPRFRDLCNRIGAELGLDVVAAKNQIGSPCKEWPCCVRPPGYYEGVYGSSASRELGEVEPPCRDAEFDQSLPDLTVDPIDALHGLMRSLEPDRHGQRAVLVRLVHAMIDRFGPEGLERWREAFFCTSDLATACRLTGMPAGGPTRRALTAPSAT